MAGDSRFRELIAGVLQMDGRVLDPASPLYKTAAMPNLRRLASQGASLATFNMRLEGQRLLGRRMGPSKTAPASGRSASA